jgi:hypothetical protein
MFACAQEKTRIRDASKAEQAAKLKAVEKQADMIWKHLRNAKTPTMYAKDFYERLAPRAEVHRTKHDTNTPIHTHTHTHAGSGTGCQGTERGAGKKT